MTAAIVARALLGLAMIGAVAVLVRRRAAPAQASAPVAVIARAALGPGVGVAVVEAGGRRLLVGFGKDGVHLVRDLGTEAQP
jgi:flagellar biogenesis protein FliO